MAGEKFCLRLTDFETNVGKSWQDLQSEKDFSDLTLACDGKQFETHKVIVSSCSPILRKILKQNPNQHPLIYLRGVKNTDFNNILNFIYRGEVNIEEEELASFLAVAEDLQIKGLCERNANISNAGQEGNTKFTNTLNNVQEGSIINSDHIEIGSNIDSDGPLQKRKKSLKTEFNETDKKLWNTHSQKIHPTLMEINDTNQSFGKDKIESTSDDGISMDLSDSCIVAPIENGLKYSCDQCDKQFTQLGNLTRHKKSVHDDICYSCDKCDFKSNRKDGLKIHTESVHMGIRQNCSLCSFTATNKANINAHIRKMHTTLE